MTEPDDNARLLLTVLFAAWVFVFGYAFVAYFNAGKGAFLGWQGVAGCIALAIFGVSRSWPKGAQVRTIGTAPIVCTGLIVLVIAGQAVLAKAG